MVRAEFNVYFNIKLCVKQTSVSCGQRTDCEKFGQPSLHLVDKIEK